MRNEGGWETSRSLSKLTIFIARIDAHSCSMWDPPGNCRWSGVLTAHLKIL